MWPFPIFPRTGPVAFLYMFICHLPTNSSGGVANAFLQSSDVEEVVWVSHMKSASGQNDILQNVGGMMKRTGFKEADFVCISPTKTLLRR